MQRSTILVVPALFFSLLSFAQSKDEKEILGILDKQTQAWNRGDLDSFMIGYWKSDSLMYIGSTGVTYGYDYTLANYKQKYGDTARMGKLTFTILQLRELPGDYYFVVGKWHLKRSIGDIGGHYSLLFRKIMGKWTIVADHSS